MNQIEQKIERLKTWVGNEKILTGVTCTVRCVVILPTHHRRLGIMLKLQFDPPNMQPYSGLLAPVELLVGQDDSDEKIINQMVSATKSRILSILHLLWELTEATNAAREKQ